MAMPGSRCSCAKVFIKAMGYSDDALERPIVGITNTASDFNPCHGNAPQLIEAVKRGVMLAGAMPMVFPDHLHPRKFCAPDLDVPAQSDGDGHRGDDPGAAHGCGRADRWLRQDFAGADHGRGQRRPADDRRAGRPDGRGPSSRRSARRLYGLSASVGRLPGRAYRRGRDRRRRKPPRAVGWHLHGDGDGVDDRLHGRGDGARTADERDDPRAACRTHPARGGERPGRGTDGGDGRTEAERTADARIVP